MNDIYILDDSTGSFTITDLQPTIPAVLPPGATLDVEVTFTPTSADFIDGTWVVESTAHVNPAQEVYVSGTGVEAEPPPCPAIADILDFYDTAVGNESLMGYGPGNSAHGRLKALRNIIAAAGDLIDNGELELAYLQLLDAYDRCDGAPRPPDFVAGPAADDLNDLLYLLLTCED